MKNRGPDNQNFNIFKTRDKICLFSVKYYDLDVRANQPFRELMIIHSFGEIL